MPIDLPEDTRKVIEEGNKKVKEWVEKNLDWKAEDWPKIPKKEEVKAEVLVESNPILGIEKYLGMHDKDQRIAHFPSLKLTNDSFRTKLYLKFDPSLKEDIIIFGDKFAEGKDLKRFMKIVNFFRELVGIKTKVLIISIHIPKVELPAKAKGLGLSASAGGAAAKALIEAALPEFSNNNRFLNVVARYLSGSATSSAAGGFSVWFSHRGIDSKDCYAVRIDKDVDAKLVVVPIPKAIKTEDAHGSAEKSPWYEHWARNKPENVTKLMEKIKEKDIDSIGKIAELDSLNLFHLLVSGGEFFNWDPFTLDVLRKVVLLRMEKGLKAYCSMDTGPSVAIVTDSKSAEKVKEEIEKFVKESGRDYPIYIADIAGPPRKLDLSEKDEILTPQVKELLRQKGVKIE
ncbi:MAG: hypothetical protein GTN38_01630 [Candidatus Aenigmarchaeota archaeon]|nr:hypothetical protein [Candidatus Aenigmarchaeota archaeon]NIQ17280.1 hypothetical protein [Candidatus Aenigmarchaeota archaeon]NIS73141.1 hypothetical protein [Candidatus Aenigmarchaeota archaeon]